MNYLKLSIIIGLMCCLLLGCTKKINENNLSQTDSSSDSTQTLKGTLILTSSIPGDPSTVIGQATLSLCDAVTQQPLSKISSHQSETNGSFSIDYSKLSDSQHKNLLLLANKQVTYKGQDAQLLLSYYISDLATLPSSITLNAQSTALATAILQDITLNTGDLLSKTNSIPDADHTVLASDLDRLWALYDAISLDDAVVPTLHIPINSDQPDLSRQRLYQIYDMDTTLQSLTLPGTSDQKSSISALRSSLAQKSVTTLQSATFDEGLQLPQIPTRYLTDTTKLTLPALTLPAATKFSNSVRLPSPITTLPERATLQSGFELGDTILLSIGTILGAGFTMPDTYSHKTNLPSDMSIQTGAELAQGAQLTDGMTFDTDYELKEAKSFTYSTSFVMHKNLTFESGYTMPSGKTVLYEQGFIWPSDTVFGSDMEIPKEVVDFQDRFEFNNTVRDVVSDDWVFTNEHKHLLTTDFRYTPAFVSHFATSSFTFEESDKVFADDALKQDPSVLKPFLSSDLLAEYTLYNQLVFDSSLPITTCSVESGAYRSDQTVTLTSSGGNTIYYKLDGTPEAKVEDQYTAPFVIDSTRTLRFFSQDSIGQSGLLQERKIVIDKTAPIVECIPASGFYKSLSAKLSANEPATIYAKIGSAPSTDSSYLVSATDLLSVSFSITESSILYFFAIDAIGNQSDVANCEYTIDTVAPTTFSTVSTGTYNTAQTVTLSLENGESGSSFFTTQNITASAPASSDYEAYTDSFDINTTTTLYFYSVDLAGNQETPQSIQITMDISPPTTVSNTRSGAYPSARTVSFTTEVDATTFYKNVPKGTNEKALAFLTYSGIPVSISSDHTIYYYSQDALGNTETTQQIVIEITAEAVVYTLSGVGASPIESPSGIVIRDSGDIIFSDADAQLIQQLQSDGSFLTLSGQVDLNGAADGSSALWNAPHQLALSPTGAIIVADTQNHRIRRMDSSGIVTTITGSSSGNQDGHVTSASFQGPESVAIDPSGAIYIADTENHRIRKILISGQVITLAGGSEGLADGSGSSAMFSFPKGIAVDSAGTIYVADTLNHQIRKVSQDGVVTTISGSTAGFQDGFGTAAQFDQPMGLTVDGNGNLYVADRNNHRIRKMTPNGEVVTLAGGNGFKDAKTADARFYHPEDVDIVRSSGSLIVADTGNKLIRIVTQPDYVNETQSLDSTPPVTTAKVNDSSVSDPTLFQSHVTVTLSANEPGSIIYYRTDGGTANSDSSIYSAPLTFTKTTSLSFFSVDPANNSETVQSITFNKASYPTYTSLTPLSDSSSIQQAVHLVGNSSGDLFVTDFSQDKILKMELKPQDTILISDWVSSFEQAYGITYQSSSNQLFASNRVRLEQSYGAVQKISAGGTLSSFVQGSDFPIATAMALDPEGNLILGSQNKILKISPSGSISILPGSNVFSLPTGIAIHSDGTIYVSDSQHTSIRSIKDGLVSDITGISSLNAPNDITLDTQGNLYVADTGNKRIIKWNIASQTETILGIVPSGASISADRVVPQDAFASIPGFSNQNSAVIWDQLKVFKVLDANGKVSSDINLFNSSVNLGLSDATQALYGDQILAILQQSITHLFNQPHGLWVDSNLNLYVIDANGSLWKVIQQAP